MRKNLTKIEILRQRNDIKRAFLNSKICGIQGLKLRYRKNNFLFSRVLITFTRNYGNSVTRNRQKRIVKEIFRQLKPRVKTGFDIVFIILPGVFSFQERHLQIEKVLKMAELLHAEIFANEQ